MINKYLVNTAFIIFMVIGVSLFSVIGYLLIEAKIAFIWLAFAILGFLVLLLSAFFPAKVSKEDKEDTNETNQSPFKNFVRNVWGWDFPRGFPFSVALKHILKTPNVPDKPDSTNYHPFHMFRRIIGRVNKGVNRNRAEPLEIR